MALQKMVVTPRQNTKVPIARSESNRKILESKNLNISLNKSNSVETSAEVSLLKYLKQRHPNSILGSKDDVIPKKRDKTDEMVKFEIDSSQENQSTINQEKLRESNR